VSMSSLRKYNIKDVDVDQLDCNKLYTNLDEVFEQKRIKDLDLIKRKRDIMDLDD